jgi:hypothetical protein
MSMTSMDARALVSEIRQLLEAATPGPWRWDPHASHPTEMPELLGADDQTVCHFGDREQYYPTEGSAPGDADAALIAAAPRLLTAALGLIEQQQEALQDISSRFPAPEILNEIDADESSVLACPPREHFSMADIRRWRAALSGATPRDEAGDPT